MLDVEYKGMLMQYKDYIKLTFEEIDMLVDGYRKRIECLRKIIV